MTPQSLEMLRDAIRDFARAREWEQFHTPKNLVMALSVEVAELTEPFQWLAPEQAFFGIARHDPPPRAAGYQCGKIFFRQFTAQA